MSDRAIRIVLYLAILLLYLLHNDFWLWNDAGAWMGFPAGLTYHVLYCIVTAGLMYGLVLYAWPDLDPEES